VSPGAEMIVAERQRQIDVEGWTAEHDAAHDGNDLACAALCYLVEAYVPVGSGVLPEPWPWAATDWKPAEDPVRNLVKAGALISAEIDRGPALTSTSAACPTANPA
jgi:hypothetical protein